MGKSNCERIWNGRMKACRGVGASLSKEKLKEWESEHLKMLSEIAPEEFDFELKD